MIMLDAFQSFTDHARVWVYQANRTLDATEIVWVNDELTSFIKSWAAHGRKLRAEAKMITPFSIAFVVQDDVIEPSGCSIDASVHFVKKLEKELQVDFFSRMYVWVKAETEFQRLHISKLSDQKEDLLIYDPLIADLGSLRNTFLVSLAKSSLSHVMQA
jgi:hypothetical protein